MKSSKHDELLLQYLETLDTYQSQMKKLSSELSNGYLALAQANFHATGGVRYGQDFYDERMTAVKQVEIQLEGKRVEFALRQSGTTNKQHIQLEEGSPTEIEGSNVRRRKVGGAQNDTVDEKKVEVEEDIAEDESRKMQVNVKDPIRWFGILVPQSLRTSQSHFSNGLELLLPLATTISKLESLCDQLSYFKDTKHIYKILTSPPTVPLPSSLPLSPLDTESGYIHLCTGSQVIGVISRFMNDATKLWVLRIPYERVADDIKWEAANAHDEGGERFPHLFAGLGRKETDAWTVLNKSDKGWEYVFEAADWKNLEVESNDQ